MFLIAFRNLMCKKVLDAVVENDSVINKLKAINLV